MTFGFMYIIESVCVILPLSWQENTVVIQYWYRSEVEDTKGQTLWTNRQQKHLCQAKVDVGLDRKYLQKCW